MVGMKSLLRVTGLAVLLAALAVAAITVDLPELGTIRDWLSGFGAAAPLIFLFGYALIVLAPVPKSVLSAAAGLAFGLPVGIAVVLGGATLGALGAFGVGRALGRDAISRHARGHLIQLDAALERHGLLAALMVRLIPVMPFTLLNYACGVTAMRWRHYALGTVAGLLPGTTVLVALGAAGRQLPTAALAAASIGLGTGSVVVGLIRHRRLRSGPERTRSGPEPFPGVQSRQAG